MNKTELIERLAATCGLSRNETAAVLDGLLETITEALRRGEDVTLTGFGTFTVKQRAARMGRNPRTGESVAIAASRSPGFKAGKSLKDALN
jgi:DNA-binding protein HU-beta